LNPDLVSAEKSSQKIPLSDGRAVSFSGKRGFFRVSAPALPPQTISRITAIAGGLLLQKMKQPYFREGELAKIASVMTRQLSNKSYICEEPVFINFTKNC
jgi:hypothetical protein